MENFIVTCPPKGPKNPIYRDNNSALEEIRTKLKKLGNIVVKIN